MEESTPSSSVSLSCLPADCQKFLDMFSGIDGVTFRCIPELPTLCTGTPKVYPIVLSPYKYNEEEQNKLLLKANEAGFSAFYFPQKTKDSETCKESDILAYRALVLDLDGNPLEPALNFRIKPSAVIETSPKRYQCVYVFEKELAAERELTSKQFKVLSEKLAIRLGGDRAVCDAAHIFRLPGLKHWKSGKSVISKLISMGSKVAYKDLADSLLGAYSGNYDGSYPLHNPPAVRGSANAAQEVPLAAVLAGNVTVKEGERHDVLKRLCVKLAHEGRAKENIIENVDTLIKNTFSMPVDFLEGGKDYTEKLRLVDAALGYRKEEVAKTEAVLKEAKHKEIEAEVVSGFKLDTSAGAMSLSKYSAEAIFERILQRHFDKFIRVGNNVLVVFNPRNCMWTIQNQSNFGLLRELVQQELLVMFKEADFILAKGTTKGALDKHKLEAAIAAYQTARYVKSICTDIMIHSTKYKQVENFNCFEPNPHLFYCANGVLDLRTGEFRQPKPSDMLMHQSEVVYSPTATCEKWIKNLHQVLADDESTEYTPETEDKIRGFRSVWSYSLGRHTTERCIFLYKGGGINGKSCLFYALKKLLGSYGTTLGPDKLSLGDHKTEKPLERLGYILEGKRIAIVDDLTVGGKWNDGLVKNLTADTIRIRGLYQEESEMPNVTKLHIGLNGKCPTPQGDDVSLVRRLFFIPFSRQFEKDAALELSIQKDIDSELPGILNWLLADYQSRHKTGEGVYRPVAGIAEWEEYQQDSYPINKVINAMYEKAPRHEDKYLVQNTVLTDEIQAYCNSESYRVLNVKPVDFDITFKSVANAFSRLLFKGKLAHPEASVRTSVKHWYVKRKLV